jgi:biopolymer transport protein ExbD
MAEIIANDSGGKKGHGKKRAKKHSTHIDMTPMVDLMSLLITFFMLTTAFTKPKVMDIILPEQEDNDTSKAPEIIADRTLNLLLTGEDKVFYYVGKPPMNEGDVKANPGRLIKTDYSKDGVRKVVLKMNLPLYEKVDSARQDVITGKSKISQDSLLSLIKFYGKKDRLGPIVMIKTDKKAKYRNIVDVIDEMAICNVARYTIVPINEYELKLLETAPK